jgi:hypothetical protein
MLASYALRSSCSKPIVQNSTIPRETRAGSSNCECEGIWPVSRTTLLLWALDRLNYLNRASVWRDALLCVFKPLKPGSAAKLGGRGCWCILWILRASVTSPSKPFWCGFLVTSMYLLLLLQLILMQCDGTVYGHCHPLKSRICQLHLAATVNGESHAQ